MRLGKRLRQLGISIAALALVIGSSPFSAGASSLHLIAPGETLTSIAARYGVDLYEIARFNGIANPNVIYAGAELRIPGAAAASGGSSAPASTGGTGVHVVVAGDTLIGIALRYGTTVQAILQLNDMIYDPNLIFVGQTLLVPASGGSAGSATTSPSAVSRPSHAEVAALLEYYANLYGLSPALVKAIAWQESGWRQDVISSSGAVGVMQVMPATGGWVASEIVGRPLNLYNSVDDNIIAGVAYLDWLIRYTGSVEIAVASYYQGPGSMSRNGMFVDTRRYVDNVFAIRDHILAYGAPPYP
jgi:N-acetylmuramoyl-L-alanine amidase